VDNIGGNVMDYSPQRAGAAHHSRWFTIYKERTGISQNDFQNFFYFVTIF